MHFAAQLFWYASGLRTQIDFNLATFFTFFFESKKKTYWFYSHTKMVMWLVHHSWIIMHICGDKSRAIDQHLLGRTKMGKNALFLLNWFRFRWRRTRLVAPLITCSCSHFLFTTCSAFLFVISNAMSRCVQLIVRRTHGVQFKINPIDTRYLFCSKIYMNRTLILFVIHIARHTDARSFFPLFSLHRPINFFSWIKDAEPGVRVCFNWNRMKCQCLV